MEKYCMGRARCRSVYFVFFFFFQAEDGIRDVERSRGLGDVYKRQVSTQSTWDQRRVHGLKLGYIDPHKISQYEKESRSIGKATFQYAWVLDESDLERERGVTINIAVKHLSLIHI
eukprot:TRINITY_DN11973_c0_g1_i2.p2 TRINITY_DN11973_c0_g1~~TRINITY_DN11973_c0_g1_i2.p2  ORF type:complete len:116 (+),score=40.59 TRINITY_DN11973_c0_g1_i2:77-424(+)